MFLAGQGDGCDGGLDLLGMFDDPIGEMIEMVAKIVIAGAIGIFKAVGDIDSINTGASDKIGTEIRWIVMYLACGSILAAAVKMALERRGEAGTTALKGIVRVVVVAAAATTVITTFVDLMERYYDHLFDNTLNNLMEGVDCDDSIPDMLLLVIGCLLILAGIVHALLMWVRLGVMIMLMGTLPLAAAASMTDWGGTWWRKHIGWMTAWLLYKPTVALIMYSGAIMVDASEPHESADTQIAGMATLLLSAIALPALMRIIVPATAGIGGDAVGDTVMGGVASGAKSLGDAGGRSQGDAPSGSRGPSGSNGGGGTSGGGGGRGSAGASGGSGQAGKSAAAGGGGAAAAANPALAAIVVASEVAKGVANVAKSGVESADGEKGAGR
ncbi:hypothetical protein [Streptomyces sp. NBC_00286]|uniref:hypothetical protein n=1 Tax=Streptomyces sp. NBC_00286 TaxID=2975701 RepID=UPI002E28593A|nr:hypothetical protein [Streptomyces sp. NBC_00286]